MHVGLGPFPCSRHVMKIALQWEIRVVRRPGAKKALFLNSNSDVGILAVSIHTPGNRESILFCYFGHRFTKKNCFTIKNRFRIDFQMIQVPTFLGFDPALVETPELKKEFKRIHTHTRAFANKTTNRDFRWNKVKKNPRFNYPHCQVANYSSSQTPLPQTDIQFLKQVSRILRQ